VVKAIAVWPLEQPVPQAENLREFYEKDYARVTQITTIPDDNAFMYTQSFWELRPYLRPGLKVLDLGCNDGNLSLYMARKGCEVLGIDLARNAVECARKSAEHYGIKNARFESIDFVRDWNGPATFDLVLCSHVIEHVPDDKQFIQKISAALKPGGTALIFTPTPYASLYRCSKFFTGRYKHDEDVGHLRRYTRQSAIDVFSGSGLDVTKIVFMNGAMHDWFILCRPLRIFNKIWARRGIRTLFNRIDALSAKVMFPATICVHAAKPGAAPQIPT
jgi:2-polyprenyl-3-methyl-5-hydroxy-6-metoxy-1,4-benzoquinol methylase